MAALLGHKHLTSRGASAYTGVSLMTTVPYANSKFNITLLIGAALVFDFTSFFMKKISFGNQLVSTKQNECGESCQ